MALFIPEWASIPARQLQVSRALKRLDDDHVVRRPLRAPAPAALDFFIEHPRRGWLAVVLDDAPFAELDPAQLFESERRARFDARLAGLGRLGLPCATVVILLACSPEEAQGLHLASPAASGGHGPRLVAREAFVEQAERLVAEMLAPLDEAQASALRATWFPEAEIPSACTTRRFFRRDNSARLQRFFLDAEQEWASKLDLEPPPEQARTARDFSVRLINGVAGSGKTLIALNRGLLLAELFPRQPILLLIHNTPIVADLKERLHRAHGGVPANLQISTFFAWVRQQWHAAFGAWPQMAEPPMVAALVRQALPARAPDLAHHPDARLIDEIDFINSALLRDEAQYLEANRAGRGFALRPGERRQAWALYEHVADALRAANCRMWSDLPRDLCLAPQVHAQLQPHAHILIDEAQFFTPSWFQLATLALGPQGHMFLCADPNQGFMKSRLSWKRAGLDVAGRTKKLRRSYRTTRALLEAASGVLAALGAAGPVDDEDYLQPDFGGMRAGARPLLVYADTPQDALDRVVNEVAALGASARVPLNALLVIYGDNVQKFDLHAHLSRQLGAHKVWWLNERDQKKAPPHGYGHDYLRLAYLDTATGLEGSAVFLVGMEPLFVAGDAWGLQDEERAERREASARKLYMAMTRAGQRLVLVASQRLPPALEALFEVAA